MKKYLAEFIGTFFLIFTIWMTVPTSMVTGAGMMTRLSIGLSLMVMVYAGAHISGAHYNPAITLAVWMRRKISGIDAVLYVAVQIAAAVIASLLVMYMLDASQLRQEGTPVKDSIKALMAEFLGAFALVYVYLNVMKDRTTNSYYGLAIGLTVPVMAYSLGTISGGVFNPVVFISGGIIKWGVWSDAWIYLVGGLGGAALASVVFSTLTKAEI
jgi:aquaporin Z